MVQHRSRPSTGVCHVPDVVRDIFDELASKLRQAGGGIAIRDEVRLPSIFYADDIVILAESPQQLQKALDITTIQGEEHRFEFNIDKSGTMVVGTKPRSPYTWDLNGEALSMKNSYEYLGVEVSNNL